MVAPWGKFWNEKKVPNQIVLEAGEIGKNFLLFLSVVFQMHFNIFIFLGILTRFGICSDFRYKTSIENLKSS